MPSIWDVAKAVRESDLPAPARHIMSTLALMASVDTAVVPYEYTPSLTTLARITGLGRSTVARELTNLEAAGWIVRVRPSIAKARAEKARTQYRLSIPASPALGLVPLGDQPTSPTQGLASPAEGPELVPERDLASPRAGHVTTKGTTRTTNTQKTSSSGAAKPRSPRSKPADDSAGAETTEQRINRLSRIYTERVPLSNFLGVRAVVKKAVSVGVTDELIICGLEKLAADNRAVTTDSLRYAIYGVPPSQFHARNGANGSRTTGANRHIDQRDDNPFRTAANGGTR